MTAPQEAHETSETQQTPSKEIRPDVSVAISPKASASDEPIREIKLTGPRLGAVFTVLCLAVFLVALDNTIISTAIPRITDEFQALEDVGWYGSSYLLTTCMFQLVFGKLYGYFPIKIVFLAGVVIFEVGSAVCAIAGLGASGIFQGAMVIVAYSVDSHKRPMYNGIFGSIYGIFSIVGPLLGGAFTSHVTWRWCFYINLPIGGVVIVILALFLQVAPITQSEPNRKTLIQHMDPLGMVTFLPAIVCLLLALQWGGTTYPWSNARSIVLFVLAGLLLAIFIGIQLKLQENAMVPPRVIRMSPIAYSSVFMIVFSGAYFTIVYYLPIWFQAIKGASAVNSGIMCLPLMLSMVLFSFITGGGVTATGKSLPFFIMATILSTTGAGLVTTLETDTGHQKWIGYQVLVSAGVGMGVQLPVITAQAVLPAPDIPVGTAIVTFCQTFSGAIFVAVSQALFANRLRSGILATVSGISPSIVQQIGATNLDAVINQEHMPAVREVYNEALVSTWYLAVALFVASVVIVGAMALKMRK
ncbi:major facilitator superfamily domain-containing protein [Aspergillus pseudoustus]|uniref:Major facilitator superfamily domain-containing protein n=1 Tax=Aspergillus pseudoustus TaxID=1810923 RepID=A0ABR4JRR6_9EURO